jgi:Zn-finger nucleic acid-binding protein
MDCPRCKLPLVQDRYEGVPVDVCRECWGYWLDRGEFSHITTRREYVFSDEERTRLLSLSPKTKPTAVADPPIPCPRCGETMAKVDFAVKVPITIDRCASHGIWLDARELKLAQVLAEDAAAVRHLFFQKLNE